MYKKHFSAKSPEYGCIREQAIEVFVINSWSARIITLAAATLGAGRQSHESAQTIAAVNVEGPILGKSRRAIGDTVLGIRHVN